MCMPFLSISLLIYKLLPQFYLWKTLCCNIFHRPQSRSTKPIGRYRSIGRREVFFVIFCSLFINVLIQKRRVTILLLAFHLGYRQVTCYTTSVRTVHTFTSVNFQLACSRIANIGGIQMEENKSREAQMFIFSSFQNGNAFFVGGRAKLFSVLPPLFTKVVN